MKWQEDQGAWSEIFEGVLYAEQEKDIPSWFAESYKKYYPPFSDYDKLKEAARTKRIKVSDVA